MRLARSMAGPLAAFVALIVSGVEPCETWAESTDPSLRILVDKVLMQHNDWVLTEQHVAEVAAAGFNALSPRRGGENPDTVRQVARWCQAHGLVYLPWMRGTLSAEPAADATDRLVWADGRQQDLFAPNSDTLWAWLEERLVSHARLSLEQEALTGTFLDFENYAPGRQGNAYPVSFDAQALAHFADAHRLQVPDLPPNQRSTWLRTHGHLTAFEAFSIEQWQLRCRRLRQRLDKINPAFRLAVYPSGGTRFIEEAIWKQWSTPQAPLILADASTYGRPDGLLPQLESLALQRERLKRRHRRAAAQVEDLTFLGGIDPVVRGADPEYSGKNAVMIDAAVDGYWVFYEGPDYEGEHPQYFAWFDWSNDAITTGRSDAWREPRTTPDPWDAAQIDVHTTLPQVGVYGLKPRMVELLDATGRYEVHELRGMSPTYLKQLDVVVLQNFNVAGDRNHPFVAALRDFVASGGGLMLAHDTAWFLASPIPEVAVRGLPENNVEATRHVVDTQLNVVLSHPAVSVAEGTSFETEFRDHMIFRAGPQGRVLVENRFGEPVYVAGEFGQGRVLYSGSYYGYTRSITGHELSAFLAGMRWLASP